MTPELLCSNREACAAFSKVTGLSLEIPEGSPRIVRDAWHRGLRSKGISAELDGSMDMALRVQVYPPKEPGIRVSCRVVFRQREGFTETMIEVYRYWPNDWGTGEAIGRMRKYLGK